MGILYMQAEYVAAMHSGNTPVPANFAASVKRFVGRDAALSCVSCNTGPACERWT
jgi:hypothetical protein